MCKDPQAAPTTDKVETTTDDDNDNDNMRTTAILISDI